MPACRVDWRTRRLPPRSCSSSAGFVLGAEGLGWLNLSLNEHNVSVLAEATLASCCSPMRRGSICGRLRREYAVPVRLLSIGLPLTIIAGAIVGALVLPGVTLAEAGVLAIVLAPTDAALGQAVVTDVRLPSRIRQALNVESGLNDGLCVPLLAIMLAVADVDSGRQTPAHATQLVVEAIGWGVFGGIVAGVVGGGLLRLARDHDLIADAWVPVVPLMAALGSFAIADALGGSGFIAAFVGGVVYRRVARPNRSDPAHRADRERARRGDLHRVRRGDPRWRLVEDRSRRGRLRGAEPHRHSNGAGRDRDARDPCPSRDGRILGLVRAAGSRVDRVRDRRRRGRGTCRTRRCSSSQSLSRSR